MLTFETAYKKTLNFLHKLSCKLDKPSELLTIKANDSVVSWIQCKVASCHLHGLHIGWTWKRAILGVTALNYEKQVNTLHCTTNLSKAFKTN